MAKYDPLFRHLVSADAGPIDMTFDEIERLVGALPASALKYSAWWSNHQLDGAHVQAMRGSTQDVKSRPWTGRDVESVSVLLVGVAARSPDFGAQSDRSETGPKHHRFG